MKNQKGITLIALIITIIVMLILVGVSVTVALNGGLFSTAQQATNKTQLELDKEQLLMAAIGAFDENGKVDFAELDANLPEGFTESEGVYTSKSGNKFTISEYGSVTEVTESEGGSGQEPGDNTTGGEGTGDDTTGYTAYVVGNAVTVNGEDFYVLKDSSSSESTVTLLAKDCIVVDENSEKYLKQDTSAGEVEFSSTNYWLSETEYPVNLNDYTIPEGETSVITTAKAYGAEVGGTGRLMTYEEATALKTANSDILYGRNGTASGDYLDYWLGSADSVDSLWVVVSTGPTASNIMGSGGYEYNGPYPQGIRPVVEISKSLI